MRSIYSTQLLKCKLHLGRDSDSSEGKHQTLSFGHQLVTALHVCRSKSGWSGHWTGWNCFQRHVRVKVQSSQMISKTPPVMRPHSDTENLKTINLTESCFKHGKLFQTVLWTWRSKSLPSLTLAGRSSGVMFRKRNHTDQVRTPATDFSNILWQSWVLTTLPHAPLDPRKRIISFLCFLSSWLDHSVVDQRWTGTLTFPLFSCNIRVHSLSNPALLSNSSCS